MTDHFQDADRIGQAMVLWEDGWGRELGFEDFQTYLDTVPEVPSVLRRRNKHFPYLVLVDGRAGYFKQCFLRRVSIPTDYFAMITSFDRSRTKTGIRWMRCQSGRRHRDLSVSESREKFGADEIGLDLVEGMALYLQFPSVFRGHNLLLPNTVTTGGSKSPGSLGMREGSLHFGFSWGDQNSPSFGSASRLVIDD